jgi:hypothetical protein
VDERRGVVKMEGTGGGYALGSENGHGELLAKPTISVSREEVSWCINVNHGHSKTSNVRKRLDIYINRHETKSVLVDGRK